MTVTVLFDLDDTLLENEMGTFLPAYFSLIQNSLDHLLPPERMLPIFLSASQKMMEEQRMDRPLIETFINHIIESEGLARGSVQAGLDGFYAEIYPTLRSRTHPVPGAQRVVQEFANRGYRMAIATNPFFPLTAVLQRVDWAELPVPISRFERVTAMETVHFVKPNPAFFAEVMAYLGWPDTPVVIGNDPVNDVLAGSQLGLATYLVNGSPAADSSTGRTLRGIGAIESVLAWLDGLDPESLKPDYRSPEAVLAIYRSTAAVVDTTLRQSDEEAWQRSAAGEWTAHQVLHHLMEVEEKVNLPRIRSLLNQANPFISGVDTDAWYADGFPELGSIHDTFERFLEVRTETVRLLSELDEQGWQLPARHAIFGPTDLLEISHIMARHDQLHIRQFRELFHPGSA